MNFFVISRFRSTTYRLVYRGNKCVTCSGCTLRVRSIVGYENHVLRWIKRANLTFDLKNSCSASLLSIQSCAILPHFVPEKPNKFGQVAFTIQSFFPLSSLITLYLGAFACQFTSLRSGMCNSTSVYIKSGKWYNEQKAEQPWCTGSWTVLKN